MYMHVNVVIAIDGYIDIDDVNVDLEVGVEVLVDDVEGPARREEVGQDPRGPALDFGHASHVIVHEGLHLRVETSFDLVHVVARHVVEVRLPGIDARDCRVRVQMREHDRVRPGETWAAKGCENLNFEGS